MDFKRFTWVAALLALSFAQTDAQSRWKLADNGGIVWNVAANDSHNDHIEMSGKSVSVVLRYNIDHNGAFTLNKSMIWPLLRTIPNNTHASLMRRYNWNPLDGITVNGRAMTGEKVTNISLKGILNVESLFDQGYYGQWKLTRTYFPSTELPALVEMYRIENTGKRPLNIEIPEEAQKSYTNPQQGVTGSYCIEAAIDTKGYFT
ncbi:MAG: hypothetical protein K2I11_05095, partial [Bacteroides sp.]|nr:hypothetical protein [Bacteroides sp.]